MPAEKRWIACISPPSVQHRITGAFARGTGEERCAFLFSSCWRKTVETRILPRKMARAIPEKSKSVFRVTRNNNCFIYLYTYIFRRNFLHRVIKKQTRWRRFLLCLPDCTVTDRIPVYKAPFHDRNVFWPKRRRETDSADVRYLA